MIYQELSLAPHLSVMENIVARRRTVPLRRRSSGTACAQTATDALAELGHPDIARRRGGRDAVGRRAAARRGRARARRRLPRARARRADQQPRTRDDARRLFDLIARLRTQGHAIVYISHFIEEVKESRRSHRRAAGRTRRGHRCSGRSVAAADRRLMVGRDVDDLYPRIARQRGESILEVDALVPGSRQPDAAPRRDARASRAWSAPAGRRLLRALFGLEPVRERTREARSLRRTGARPPAAGVRASGMLSEDRDGEGLALGLGVGDNVTLSRLDGLGPGVIVLPARQDRGGSRSGSSVSVFARAVPVSRSTSCRAAISRRSRSPACCITTSTCSSSTSRRAASTSPARRRSTP